MTLFDLEQKCLEYSFLSRIAPKFWKYSAKRWRYYCFLYQSLTVLVTLYIIFCEFLFIYRNFHNIYEVTACVAPFIAHILNLSKLYTLWYRNDEIQEMIAELREMARREKNPKYMEILRVANRQDQFVARFIIVLYIVISTIYSLRPILRNMLYMHVYHIEPIYEMPTISAYLFDEKESPAYEISYVVCVFCLFSSAAVHYTSDTIFMGCVLNISCHFDILAEMIHECEMRTFINYHRKVLGMSTELNELFKATIFNEYLLCGMLICVNGFQLVMVKDLAKLIIAACFGLAAIFTLFVYAYGGQEIMDKSTKVCDQMYELNKDYLLITMRSHKPLKIEAGFFHACLPTFMAILNSAGSMITLLESLV